MIDQFDWHRYTRSRASRATTAESAAALRGATQRSSARQSSAGRLARSASIFMGRHVLLIVFALLILFPIGGVIAGYMARPKADSAEQASEGVIGTTPDSSDKTKPAPGRPFLAQSQEPPPVVMHHPPTATLEQQEAHSMQIPARPLTPAPALPGSTPPSPTAALPAPAANQPYTPTVYSARHDKVFGEGCSGQLTLDTTGLAFRCPDDPGGSVRVALGDIEAVDGNGVRLTSGKKYHFSIAGMGKSNAEQLFSEWLSRVR